MKKSIVSFLIVLFVGIQVGLAQNYTLSSIEKTDKESMQYEILGKVGSHYWVFKNNEGVNTIAQYNNQMQLVKQNDLAFLPKGLSALEFVTYDDKVVAFFQLQVNSTVYAYTAFLNSDGQLIGTPKIIDTAEKIRPGSKTKVFNLIQSDDHKKIVIFSVNTTRPNFIKVRRTNFDADFTLLSEAEISIKSQDQTSNLSDFAVDNQGNLFCLRNKKQQNSAPAVSLLNLSADGISVVESPIINTILLLDNIRLKIDNTKGQVILNSFYATTKKGSMEGLFSYVWDIKNKKEMASNANRFTDGIRGAVSAKRNLKDAFDDYYIDKVSTLQDGSYVVVAEDATSYSNRNNFSRWDFYFGGAFYNPFMFNFWNRPFGFYPWGSFGWGGMWGMNSWGMNPWMFNRWGSPFSSYGYSNITYTANKVAFISMDAKGNIQSVKTIDKSQSDQNVDQFIGYGTMDNNTGLHLVHYEKNKGIRQLIVNSLTKEGQLARGSAIVLKEKNYEWMPRSLKQVEQNEAILPYQFKNRIGFAKIKINN